MNKHKGGIVGFVFFLVVLTIFASGAVAVYIIFMNPEAKTKVPQFVGLSNSEAVAQAERLDLILQLQPVASTLPEGRVLAQSPSAGSELRKGLVVVLQVSQGGELHAIPDVKGKTLSQAQNEIKSGGFALGDVIKINESNVKPGTVIAQSPAAPANVASGRKIDLLVQAGASSNSNSTATVPDVNRMTESEARNLLETSGIKVQAVERVYSPLLPEGLAIETKPGAGSTLRAGQGVTLKLATQRRPAGFMDGNSASNSNSSVRRVTSQQNENKTPTPSTSQTQTQSQTKTANSNRGVTVSVGGQEDVIISDNSKTEPIKTTADTSTQKNSAPSTAKTETQAKTQTSQASSSSGGGSKTARIRYVVPPIISKPMDLRIEITDPAGKREVMNRQVKGGESINTTAKYSQECVISIYLGGEFVWQERQK